MEAKVLGLGNALVDILVRIPNDDILRQFNLPKGSMQLVDEERQAEILQAVSTLDPQIVSGGSAANTIYGLANLGVNVGFVGKTSSDELGNKYREDLGANGIIPHMLSSNTRTGSCISLISPDSERTMVTCLGAAVELTKQDIDPKIISLYSHLYVEGYLVQNYELIEAAFSAAKDAGLVTILDLASYNVVEDNLDFMQKLIRKYVDVVFANEEEATAFTGKEDQEALNEIGELAETVILKQGRRGSLVRYKGVEARVGITKNTSIDTTGAGDLYAAGFIYGMINGKDARTCAEIGAITSGNVIEVIGTKMDARRWTDIRQAVKNLL